MRRGSPLPEVTLVLTESDPAAALARLDTVTGDRGIHVERTTVDGVEARRLTVHRAPVYYAVVDGKLVVTDSIAGIEGLKDGGKRLADDALYKEAAAAARVPDEVGLLVYANVRDAQPLVGDIASLAHTTVPDAVGDNLAPVRAYVGYATRDGADVDGTSFLDIG